MTQTAPLKLLKVHRAVLKIYINGFYNPLLLEKQKNLYLKSTFEDEHSFLLRYFTIENKPIVLIKSFCLFSFCFFTLMKKGDNYKKKLIKNKTKVYF